MRLDVNCGNCGIKLVRYSKHDRDTKTFYCSSECERINKDKNKITIVCQTCGGEFKAYKSQTHKKFCSRKCATDKNGTNSHVDVVCKTCGVTFSKHSCYINRDQQKNHYCSSKCYNDNRKSDAACKPRNYRAVALEHADKCSACGWSEIKGVLDVHHINGDRRDNTNGNLVVLCPTHHAMLSRGYADIVNGNFVILERKRHVLKNVPVRHIDLLSDRIADLKIELDLNEYGIYAKMSRKWGCGFATARQITIRFKNGDYISLM